MEIFGIFIETKYLIIIGAVCILLLLIIIISNIKKKNKVYTNEAQTFIDTVTIRFNIESRDELLRVYQDVMGLTQPYYVTANFNEEKKELYIYTKNPWDVRKVLQEYITYNKSEGKVIIVPREENITLK